VSGREERLRAALSEALQPQQITIVDESHKHAGHASAGGGGHFVVEIVAEAFRDKNLVQRHRMVYAAADELMRSGEVHALSIHAKTPDEANP